jgi:tetratricopeptide (TPR) repeat protein
MMTIWMFFVGWVYASAPVSLEVAAGGTVSDASEAFLQGDYERAAQDYAYQLELGRHNSDVYYNLGNSLYRAGQSGRALLAWRIAQELQPRRGDTQANILHVRRGLDDSLEPPSSMGPLFLGDSLSLKEQAWVAALLTGLVGLLVLWGRKRRDFPIGIPALLLGGPGFLLTLSAFLTCLQAPSVVVLESVELRSALGLNGGVLLRELEEGSELQFVDQVQDFVLVELESGESGWLPLSRIGFVDPNEPFPL